MILEINTTVKEFYLKYYTAMNGILNLTNKQLEVLAELSYIRNSFPKDYTEEQLDNYTFAPASRSLVAERMGISNYNLNNLLKVLRDKKIILKTNSGRTLINPNVYTPLTTTEKILSFKFNIKYK